MSAAIIGGAVKKPETKAVAADQDDPEADFWKHQRQKRRTKQVVEHKRGQSLSGNGTYLLCSVGGLCEQPA